MSFQRFLEITKNLESVKHKINVSKNQVAKWGTPQITIPFWNLLDHLLWVLLSLEPLICKKFQGGDWSAIEIKWPMVNY